jgi:hypothetical protein
MREEREGGRAATFSSSREESTTTGWTGGGLPVGIIRVSFVLYICVGVIRASVCSAS